VPEVRLATRDDVAGMLALSNESARTAHFNFATEPESLESWLQAFDRDHATYPWLVADGGFAKAGPHRARGAYAWSAEVSVYVTRPRQGLGRALYAPLIETMRAQGYVTALAGIALPNAPSVALHEAFGFRPCGTFHRIGFKLGAWRDVGYWELHLRDDPGAPGPLKTVASVWRHPSRA
jgi:phosphinothricin acetyltransferase